MQNTTIETFAQTASVIELGKFTGAFRQFQDNCFTDLKVAGIAPTTAHKVCNDLASDIGRLMSADPDIAARVSKAKKNGESRMAISAKAEIQTSRSMSLWRISNEVYKLYKEGLLETRQLPKLSKSLAEYIVDCEAWVSKQNWAKE